MTDSIFKEKMEEIRLPSGSIIETFLIYFAFLQTEGAACLPQTLFSLKKMGEQNVNFDLYFL